MKQLMIALVALVAFVGCVDQTNFTATGPSGGFGGGTPGAVLDGLRIEPSQFELTNGSQAVATVVATVGGSRVTIQDLTVSVSPNGDVATIISVTENVILFKAENPGNTNLVVSAGDLQAQATIRVISAN